MSSRNQAGCLAVVAVALACSAGGHAQTAWVSNEKDNTLTVIDVASLTVIDTVKVGQRPRGLVFSRDYTKLYICA